jgi:UDP-glucose 4-epimerase
VPLRTLALRDVPILVTGGLGFIGGHLVDELVAAGATGVRIFDNSRRAVTAADNWPREVVEVIGGDIRDMDALRHAMQGCEVVYHLAAQSNVMGAASDPEYSCTTNVGGTLNVLLAARDAGIHRIVFTSSREVYGDVDDLPVPETAPLHPKNLYGASKAAGEIYCGVLANDALEVAVLRLANVYGPRDQDRVIPLFVSKALQNELLTIYGGEQILDFVWIGTVVDALVNVGFGNSISGPMNIGSGTGTTIRQLASRVLDLIPSASKCVFVPTRSCEVTRFVADLNRANKFLGLPIPDDPLAHLSQLIHMIHQQTVQLET